MVQRFGPDPSNANMNLMSRMIRPPKGNVENISFLAEHRRRWSDGKIT